MSPRTFARNAAAVMLKPPNVPSVVLWFVCAGSVAQSVGVMWAVGLLVSLGVFAGVVGERPLTFWPFARKGGP